MNEIYDEGVGRAAQRAVWAVRILCVLGGLSLAITGYLIGKRAADRWWQKEQKGVVQEMFDDGWRAREKFPVAADKIIQEAQDRANDMHARLDAIEKYVDALAAENKKHKHDPPVSPPMPQWRGQPGFEHFVCPPGWLAVTTQRPEDGSPDPGRDTECVKR